MKTQQVPRSMLEPCRQQGVSLKEQLLLVESLAHFCFTENISTVEKKQTIERYLN